MATDSRLRCGRAWDVAPKILTLPRTDCAICFAGDTDDAYPLMLSMSAAIGDYPKSRSRGMDIFDVKGHTLRVFNHLRSFVSDLPRGQAAADPPNADFVFGGHSWRKKRFAIWLLHYDSHLCKFTFRPASTWRGGTWGQTDHVRRRLHRRSKGTTCVDPTYPRKAHHRRV